ncbi:hypothetical protein DXV75_12385 [Alteromonas aestuariivivens]|uniref:Uncharacterized protein n=1 Tax=Alteromonas aestuariivivens TaxID=1938339 RepID=A0A3D8M5Q5_9ALTE|nr:hypothetical protein DXV75_12385 [Alteromonas aestuariivivens]
MQKPIQLIKNAPRIFFYSYNTNSYTIKNLCQLRNLVISGARQRPVRKGKLLVLSDTFNFLLIMQRPPKREIRAISTQHAANKNFIFQ